MSDVKNLVTEATAKLHTEADRLRSMIRAKEEQLATELSDTRAELRQLEEAICRIEGKPSPSPRATERAPMGHNRKLILDALRVKPGMSAAEVAAATGLPKPTAFATLDKLFQDKKINKDREVSPVRHTLR